MARITRSHPVARLMKAGYSMKAAWAKFKGRRGGRRRKSRGRKSRARRGCRRRNMAGRWWSGDVYRPPQHHRGPSGGKNYRPSLRRRKGAREWLPTSFYTSPRPRKRIGR